MEKPYNLFQILESQEKDKDLTVVDVPKAVRKFLGELSILDRVPFHYLVPDERLLPKKMIPVSSGPNKGESEEHGSIRFFFLDPFWIKCLVNGALQIAPLPKAELLLSNVMGGFYLAEVLQDKLIQKLIKLAATKENAEEYNQYLTDLLLAKGVVLNEEKDLNNIPAPQPSTAQSNWRYSGFLFRSTLISAWKDLKVEAVGKVVPADPEGPLRALRQERLGEDTLLYICEGVLSHITIQQPPETLHFGIDGTDGKYEKELLGANPKTVPVSFRNDSKKVLNLKALAGKMGTPDSDTFARMMVARPVKNDLHINFTAS